MATKTQNNPKGDYKDNAQPKRYSNTTTSMTCKTAYGTLSMTTMRLKRTTQTLRKTTKSDPKWPPIRLRMTAFHKEKTNTGLRTRLHVKCLVYSEHTVHQIAIFGFGLLGESL